MATIRPLSTGETESITNFVKTLHDWASNRQGQPGVNVDSLTHDYQKIHTSLKAANLGIDLILSAVDRGANFRFALVASRKQVIQESDRDGSVLQPQAFQRLLVAFDRKRNELPKAAGAAVEKWQVADTVRQQIADTATTVKLVNAENGYQLIAVFNSYEQTLSEPLKNVKVKGRVTDAQQQAIVSADPLSRLVHSNDSGALSQEQGVAKALNLLAAALTMKCYRTTSADDPNHQILLSHLKLNRATPSNALLTVTGALDNFEQALIAANVMGERDKIFGDIKRIAGRLGGAAQYRGGEGERNTGR